MNDGFGVLPENVSYFEGSCIVYHGHTVCTARGTAGRKSLPVVREFHMVYFPRISVQFESGLKRKLRAITYVIGEERWRGGRIMIETLCYLALFYLVKENSQPMVWYHD